MLRLKFHPTLPSLERRALLTVQTKQQLGSAELTLTATVTRSGWQAQSFSTSLSTSQPESSFPVMTPQLQASDLLEGWCRLLLLLQ